jgi:hypothetical protein
MDRVVVGDTIVAEPVGVSDTVKEPLVDPHAESVINTLGLPVTVNVPNSVMVIDDVGYIVIVIVPPFELLYVRIGD